MKFMCYNCHAEEGKECEYCTFCMRDFYRYLATVKEPEDEVLHVSEICETQSAN